MAAKNSTSRKRSTRNASVRHNVLPTIQEAIEEERGRLMDAEAVLHCVLVAMSESSSAEAHGPSYGSVLTIARDLVAESINQLDSVRLRPMFQTLRVRRS